MWICCSRKSRPRNRWYPSLLERLPGAKNVDYLRDLPQAFAAPDRQLEVAVELLLENAREHCGQSSIPNAAFNISSVLLNGPYDGSRPAMSWSRTARVSAFGCSFTSSSSVHVSPRVMPCIFKLAIDIHGLIK